jgi:hypothetical protein
MILRDFISKSLLDLIGGIQDAQSKTNAGVIVPAGLSKSLKLVEAGGSELQVVQFEVLVRADEKSATEAGLSVVSTILGAGVKREAGKNDGHSATLRFSIPVKLPTSAQVN